VVAILDHTAAALGPRPESMRPYFEHQFESVQAAFDALQGVASFGTVITNDNTRLTGTVLCEEYPPPQLAPRGTPLATIFSQYRTITNWTPYVLERSLRLALPELSRETAPTAGRFLILFSHGYYCEENPTVIARTAREGVPTLVIGLPVCCGLDRHLAPTAEAGGLPATTGPTRYIDGYNLDAVRSAVSRAVLPTYYCRGRLRLPSSGDTTPALTADGGGAIPRDPTRAAGWEWVDAARGTLQIFGPACDDLVRRRAGVSATFSGRCVE